MRIRRRGAVLLTVAVLVSLLFVSAASGGKGRTSAPDQSGIKAFQPGETLVYDVSWSKVMKAGTAVLEVKEERTTNAVKALRFVMTSRTRGALKKLYTLGDRVQSVFDAAAMQSLSYDLEARRGKKTRRREMVFNPGRRTVVSRLNDEPASTLDVPVGVQDPLSAIYVLRTKEHLVAGAAVTIKVFDGRRTWDVEVKVLDRETVTTPAGEFSAVKVHASQGLFMSEREVLIWLTDDVRKVPVRIESKLSFGSLVFTLRSLTPGGGP